jgi:hypothetical protein
MIKHLLASLASTMTLTLPLSAIQSGILINKTSQNKNENYAVNRDSFRRGSTQAELLQGLQQTLDGRFFFHPEIQPILTEQLMTLLNDAGIRQGGTGPTGPQGAQGDPGMTGEPGPMGPRGMQGDPGSIGPQGVQGDPGALGPQGMPGMIGTPGPVGPMGPQGTPGTPGAKGETGPQGTAGGVLEFADFYAMMPSDNAANIAPGQPLAFPDTGPSSGDIVPISTTSFMLTNVGTYQIFFEATVNQSAQLIIALDSGSGPVELPYTTAGCGLTTSQINGMALVKTTNVHSTISIYNPATAPAAIRLTPNAGSTAHPVSAHLMILRIQ